MMNREVEYRLLKETLEETPQALENVTQRLTKRIRRQRYRMMWKVPSILLVVISTVFVVGVNTSTTFAYTCAQIPGLKKLVEAVATSPSLKAAAENAYVQPIGVTQELAGIAVTVEYVIVDQKQLNIFYTVASEEWDSVELTPSIKTLQGEAIEGIGTSWGGVDKADKSIHQITIDFFETTLPEQLQLILALEKGLVTERSYLVDEVINDTQIQDRGEGTEETVETNEPIGCLTYTLTVDPYYTAQADRYQLNQAIEIEAQSVVLESVTILPTHMTIAIRENEANTAFINDLEMYAVNEKGECFEGISNGVTKVGDNEDAYRAEYRLESSFFEVSESLELVITGVRYLDKSKERVRVDLENQTAEWLLEGTTFEEAVRYAGGWEVHFSSETYEGEANYQLWSSMYYDEEGEAYDISRSSSTIDDDDTRFNRTLYLEGCTADVVYMQPIFTERRLLETPIRIKIK